MENSLSIGIVTFNSADVISDCISSIKDNYKDKFPIVIADNNSHDKTREIVSSEFPDVKIVNTGKNYGFGHGVNVAVQKSDTKYVLIVNADIKVTENTIDPLIRTLDENLNCVVAAPLTYNFQNNLEGNVRRFPSIKRKFCESFFGGKIAQKLNLSETLIQANQYETQHEVDWLKGAIWCIRKSSFEKLNGMRNDFFLYSEETEFAYRANQNGLNSMIVPEAKAIHKGGESDTHELLFTLLAFNKIYFMKISNRKISACAFRLLDIVGMLLRIHKKQCRSALKALLKSFFGFENQRLKIISELNGFIYSS